MKKKLPLILLIVYIIFLIDIILLKMNIPPVIRNYDIINLIPFFGKYCTPLDIILNFLIFIPFGIYLSILDKTNTFKFTTTIFFVICLELGEYYLGTGICDITDLITNTFGMYIGTIIYKKGTKIRRHFKEDILKIATIFTIVLFLFLLVMNIFVIY